MEKPNDDKKAAAGSVESSGLFGLFAGEAYYPIGGVWDFKGRFATADEARAAIPERKNHHTGKMQRDCDWYQIVHLPTMSLIEAKGDSCYGDVDDLPNTKARNRDLTETDNQKE